MPTPRTSAIVLQWNHADLTKGCVDSLRRGATFPVEVVIVDNGSEDEAARWAAEAADVPVMLPINRGFAAGMNAGLAQATAPWVAFVNNDTVFPEGWDQALINTAEKAGVGIVAPAVSAAGNQSSVRSGPGSEQRVARPFIDLPSGVVYLMARPLAESLGGFREDYEVASAEDLDLLFTVWAVGMDVIIDDRVFVEHVGSATAEDLPGKGTIWATNRLQLVREWSDMDEQRFRARYAWDGPVRADRLDLARTTAYWMGRLFEVADERAQLSQRLERATEPDAVRQRRAWRRRARPRPR